MTTTAAGIARATFRVAVLGRRGQKASFFTVVVWRDQAEHAAQSLSKGSRVVVVAGSSSAAGRRRMAPAITAAARIAVSGWRRPLARLGSWMAAR
jgi:hypothetical protein